MWVYDSQDTLLMKVKRSQNQLYKIIINTTQSVCLLSKQVDESKLWHVFLGHVNYHAPTLMNKGNMVNGMSVIISPDVVCKGCLLSKQTRK